MPSAIATTSAARALGMIDAGVVPVLVEEAKAAVKEAKNDELPEFFAPL